ncbi:MAG: alpha-2-macroglobulin family protein, partial [Candidatus Wallbacteria bacterium]|nr:alpha-2-macroglobulin family protein [Candidatus Wallbacteria bacterium]
MFSKRIVTMLMLVLIGGAMTLFAGLWEDVEKAEKDGLPKTAIEKLKLIEEQSRTDRQICQTMKAVTRRIVLEGMIEGNKPEEKIVRIQKEIDRSEGIERQLLSLVQAQWFRHYFQRNRWRFFQRTAVEGGTDDDFTTWDLRRIFSRIDEIYQSVLSDREELKKVRLTELSDFLEKGNEFSEYWTSAYEFAAHQALEFYQMDDQNLARPEDAFTVSAASDAFADLDRFLDCTPETTDTASPVYRGLMIFQELLSWNRECDKTDSIFDNDVRRLLFVHKVAFGEGLDSILIDRLNHLISSFPGSPVCSTALFHIASIYEKQGNLLKAHEIASRGMSLFPSSGGAMNCSSLVSRIEARELELECEKIVPPGSSEMKITYRNIDRVYFRVYKDDWQKVLETSWASLDGYDYENTRSLLNTVPLKEWSLSLEPTADFQKSVTIQTIPALENGYYRVVASYKQDFSDSGNAIRVVSLWVSRLGLISRPSGARIEGIITDNVTGVPLEGVKVSVYRRNNKGFYRKNADYFTDKSGLFSVAPDKDQRDHLLQVSHLQDELVDCNSYYSYVPKREASTSVMFFTDRSIYRPGQTVYWKGIVYRVDTGKDKYEVRKGEKINVYFRDPNYQVIATQHAVSNEFGSFSGTFTAPADRLTGLCSITSEPHSGSSAVRVEEYKRPKFKLTLDPPAEGSKLGETVTVKGRAMAYTGAPIDGAVVKYRVTRQARMPYWWYWFGYDSQNSSTAQEISHGKIVTGSDGSFTVSFTARPDEKIPVKDDPSFIFSLSADCTDSAGETRSSSTRIRMGYKAMEITLKSPDWLVEDSPFDVDVFTSTLDGTGVTCNGRIEVYRLKQPEKVVRPSLFGTSRWSSDGERNASDFRLWPRGEKIREMAFSSINGSAGFNLSLSSGAYAVVAVADDGFGSRVESNLPLMVFDPAEDSFGVRVPEFLCLKSPVVKVGEELELFWATGYETGQAFIEIERDGKTLSRFWTDGNRNARYFRYPVTEQLRGGFTLHCSFIRENRAYIFQREISVPWDNKNLELSFATFRSELSPGQQEEWSIVLKGQGAEAKAVEMVAAMYDESLDAFCHHGYGSFQNVFFTPYSMASFDFANQGNGFLNFCENWNQYISGFTPDYWEFPGQLIQDYYGYEFMSRSKGGMVLKSSVRRDEDTALPSAPMAELAEGGGMMADENDGEMKKSKQESSLEGQPESVVEPQPDLNQVSARTNLNETAFFYPHLVSDENGVFHISFTMPEALTKWKFLSMAHSRDLSSGNLTGSVVTKKDLMVQPNPPRFLREGDVLEFPVKVTNMTASVLTGAVRLTLSDAADLRSMDQDFGNSKPEAAFEVPPGESRSYSWKLSVPDWTGMIVYKAVASTGKVSDGEEAMLPVLSRRLEVKESIPLWIRDKGRRETVFAKLQASSGSDTLKHLGLTLQMTSNPAWYAVQALPFLMEFPYECAEQIFNRLYANSLAQHIAG